MHQRPSSLLEHINAATRNTIVGPYGSEEKAAEALGVGMVASDPFSAQDHDGDHFRRAETPSDAIGLGMAVDEQNRPARARYSFDGQGEGELPMAEGATLEILDDRDPK